jgi:hypothetical protein
LPNFYKPDLASKPDDPFARGENDALVRRDYWMSMSDQSVILTMTAGVGANMSNEEKRAHLEDIKRGHLIDQVCVQEILPPE